MDAIIIVAAQGLDIDWVRAHASEVGTIEEVANGRIFIEHEGRRAYLGEDPAVRDELEPGELKLIENKIERPRFFVLEYQDVDFCKWLTSRLAGHESMLVDTDHGAIMTGQEFVARATDPSWDPRQPD